MNMKNINSLSKKVASKTFSKKPKDVGASTVTKVYSENINRLESIESIFHNLSVNFIEMAKAMDATSTTLEETKDSLKQQIIEKQRFSEEAALEKSNNQQKIASRVATSKASSPDSLFDGIASSLKTIVDVLSSSSDSIDLPDSGKGKGKGKGGKGGKPSKFSKFGKLGGRVLGVAGLAVGAYEASEYLKETGYGGRMAKGEGGRAEKAFREKNTDLSSQALTAEQAQDILKGSPRDIEAFGGKEKLEKIAGLQKPAVRSYNFQDTSVGGGRGRVHPDFVKMEVGSAIKPTFTPSQLKWLGNSDPTDPLILARMPPPLPGEVGGPSEEPTQLVIPTIKPTIPTAPAPTSRERVAPPVVSPEKKPAPSDTKPVKISAQQGKQAMLVALDKYKVQDPTARAAIMAQVGHESGNFTMLSENLNYSSSGLMGIFKKYFPDTATADQYARNPVKIADRVYGGRMGNAPEGSGDGFKYRGRGFIQLTGKSNYQKFGVANDPDVVSEVGTAAETAMKYMLNYKGDWGDIAKVTKYVNGGFIGLKDREKHFEAYLQDPSITTPQIMTTTPSTGVQTAKVSADVGSAKKQQTSQVVYNVNNSTTTAVKVGAPQGSSTTVARPVGTA